MKLIDADKLYEKRFTVLDNIETVPVYRSVIKAYDVRNEPTIEAIPVEWICKWLRKYGEPVLADGIYKMIEDCEKENETN